MYIVITTLEAAGKTITECLKIIEKILFTVLVKIYDMCKEMSF